MKIEIDAEMILDMKEKLDQMHGVLFGNGFIQRSKDTEKAVIELKDDFAEYKLQQAQQKNTSVQKGIDRNLVIMGISFSALIGVAGLIIALL
jgi:hypothetical protein